MAIEPAYRQVSGACALALGLHQGAAMKALLETRLFRAARGALLLVPLAFAACGGVEDGVQAGDDVAVPEPAPGAIVSGAGRLTGKTFVLEATIGSPTSPTAASKDELKLQVENPVR